MKKTKAIRNYKVEFEDKEWGFLGSKILEASNQFEAWQIAGEIVRRYYGDILEVYLIEPITGQTLKVIKKKKALSNVPAKVV